MLESAVLSPRALCRKFRTRNGFKQNGTIGCYPEVNVLDEAVIDSPPMVVYKAILDEYAGVTHWWMPYRESKPRTAKPIPGEGAIFDVTVHGTVTVKFSEKMTTIVEAKSIKVEFAGDFVGTGEWRFEPTDGKTKVQFQFNARPKRLSFVLLSPFVNLGKRHSNVMQKGFKALNSYLSKR